MNKQTFKDTYYLKEELILYCKQHGLQSTGSKEDLTCIIAYYLNTGKKKTINRPKKRLEEHIALTTIIVENMSFSEKKRMFFKQHLGASFRFNVPFQRWLKTNVGKTYQDAIDAYPTLTKSETIDKQFKYNTYIRDFFKDNKNYTLQEAITCWKYKKGCKGLHKYEKDDLKVLENK